MPLRPAPKTRDRAGPPAEEAALVTIAALVSLGRLEELERELRRAAREGLPLERIREALLQAHLFAGFPRAIEAFETLDELVSAGAFARGGASDERDGRRGVGFAFFRRIYGVQAEAVRRRLVRHHPALERWVLGHAYRRVLSRPGLSPRLRELLAVASLAALRCPRPLASHARGALRCGANPEEVREAIRAAARLLSPREGAPVERAIRKLLLEGQARG